MRKDTQTRVFSNGMKVYEKLIGCVNLGDLHNPGPNLWIDPRKVVPFGTKERTIWWVREYVRMRPKPKPKTQRKSTEYS